MDKILRLLLLGPVMLMSSVTNAFSNYQIGHISNVTYAADYVLIMMDVGPPTNCSNTSGGWMMIPSANKPMIAFVTGLWMRGDVTRVQVVVYTGSVDSSGFCQVGQLDPTE